jgi:hypothetical protein
MSAPPIPPQRLWWLAAGFGVWGSALATLYALQAIGCAFAWSAGPLRLGLAALLVAHLIVIGWLWRDLAAASPDPTFSSTHSFLHWVAASTVIAAFVATASTLGPPLLLSICM